MNYKSSSFRKIFLKHSSDSFLKIIFALVLTLITMIVFGYHIYDICSKKQELRSLIYLFTSESNILVLVVMILFFTPLRNKKYFIYLSFIALISILFTFLVNHIILDSQEITKFTCNMNQTTIHYKHTVIPILYTLFYFGNNLKAISVSQVYMCLIHPLSYFTFFLIKGLLNHSASYPYDFIDPRKPGIFRIHPHQGYPYLLLMVLVLSVLVYALAYVLTLIKNKWFSLQQEKKSRLSKNKLRSSASIRSKK
ncbi:hypothetical protein [Candidatus Phytoplasma meliae]|uniref:Integral membrane protein n=1 Tax=Candidatus Phytoplasma meliae TaxID=1848402 RepID=A0ABS5CXP0_9MOLU|nr:hypothetical protein [Candidatus Phytoplasma meliae]MBP5835736.1 hypothetical protein [Candidatus Phytoplasma meliae]